MPQTNPRWRTARILKNWKILISSQPIDRFWQNLARWCGSTFSTPVTNKISRFQKSKMTAASILKILKIAISLQRRDRFRQYLVQWCVWALQIPSANKSSRFRKPKMATAAILKNRKILISSQTIDRFWQNLACWCVSILWTIITNKIAISKIQDGGGGHLENSKNCNISAMERAILTKIGTVMRLEPADTGSK